MKKGLTKKEIVQFAESHGFSICHIGKIGVVLDTDEPDLKVVSRGDEVSAFNSVWPDVTVPGKGEILTQAAASAFNYLQKLGYDSHFVTDDVSFFPGTFKDYPMFNHRSMLVQYYPDSSRLPVEAIVRKNIFLGGNGAVEYKEKGTICGIALPSDIPDGWESKVPLFTPTDKSDKDENITFRKLVSLIGYKEASQLRTMALDIFCHMRSLLLPYNALLADTKFEAALRGDRLIIIDEVFSPDTSRLWDAQQYSFSKNIVSMDKQVLRDYITASSWKKGGEIPPPILTEELLVQTVNAYAKFLLTMKAATEGIHPKDFFATLDQNVELIKSKYIA